jgi:RNA polymerase sigma factor (sigma-70 family)
MVEALEGIYRERLADFTRAATAITGSEEAGRDVVQEAFALAIRKRRGFRGDGSLEGWVWQIVLNVARDARRKTRVAPFASEPVYERAEALGLPLQVLTDRQREVLFLHYYACLDYAAIAQALDISPGTVGATLTAARTALREVLIKEAHDDREAPQKRALSG